MALYKIIQRNSVFRGEPGDLIQAEPGPFLDAAVVSGMIERQQDIEQPDSSKKSSGKKIKDGSNDK